MLNISIIIPTYNSQDTLTRCLESIVKQNYHDYEIVLIDGKSSDRTIDIIKEFSSRYNFIRFISERDRGVYDAMNKGVNLARGEWLYFLGSDDKLYDNQVFDDIFRENIPSYINLIYGNVYVINKTIWADSNEIYDGEFSIDKLRCKNICHQGIFYRKLLFEKYGKYKLKYPICADWEINLRFFSKTEVKFIDRIIAAFYGGLTSRFSIYDPISQDLDYLCEKYFSQKQFFHVWFHHSLNKLSVKAKRFLTSQILRLRVDSKI